MGLGCWATGGPFWLDGKADGWGQVDDDESIRAIRAALGLGITILHIVDVLRDLAAQVRYRLIDIYQPHCDASPEEVEAIPNTLEQPHSEGLIRVCGPSTDGPKLARLFAEGPQHRFGDRSDRTIPIPGFKTVAPVKENCAAIEFGPLSKDKMHEIDALSDR
jgi:aryl-alcohol dehydrogenase-like predicted oxidoreductase